MIAESETAWELISHDPLLRSELDSIERCAGVEDQVVAALLQFFDKVDKMVRLPDIARFPGVLANSLSRHKEFSFSSPRTGLPA